MRLYVLEPEDAIFRVYERPLEAQMPYMDHLRFSVSDFAGKGKTDLCWTDRRALAALDDLRRYSGVSFTVDCGFRRPLGGGMDLLSPHCGGAAFDVGKGLPEKERARLRACALKAGLFPRVRMPYESGLSLHLALWDVPPRIGPGCISPAVFLLQDLLLGARLYRGALTGEYGLETRRAVLRLQRAARLPETGRMDRRCWHALRRIDKPTPGMRQ